MYSKIPYELKELDQWCCFKLMERNGRTTKMPINPMTGEFAKSNDSSTWASFETALSASTQFDGIGFFFQEPYIGIDIDDIRTEVDKYRNGDHTDNIVSEFVDLLGSYAEVSPSGNGIHIILKGELPPQGRRKGNVEIYTSGRFFTMTGNSIGGYSQIYDDSDYGKVNYLHNKYIASSEPVTRNTDYSNSGNDLSELDLIRIAENSKNGMRFKLFMSGGWEQFYGSQSEADMAFANDLAFWTSRDYAKMDSIFRQSSLYREKWDGKRGDSTYGADTLSRAIQDCSNVFSPEPADDDFQLYVLDHDTKKVKTKYYSYDDTGNAERFTDAFSDTLRYSYTRKSWYFYDGKIWTTDNEGKVKTMADEVIEKMKKERVYVPEGEDEEKAEELFRRHIKSTRQHNGKTNMIKESQHLLPIQPHHFDNDLNLLNVQNGYLDLKAGQLHPHEREKYFTKISNVEFTDKADCPLWDEFLLQIFGGDAELIEYMQRAVGYSLSGSTEEQMMFILHGNGRNGKSVFLDIVTDLFGTYSTNIQPQAIMVKQQSNNANPDIAKLAGARFVTTTEPNEGVRFDEGLIKQLTGGDRVTARFLYEDEFEFTPQFKLWMATNHKPLIRGTDDGIWRRMAIVPFAVQIPEHQVDKKLTHKLRREIDAILNWAVEGYLKWQQYGLEEPQVIKDQRSEYRVEMDSIEAFIQECCVLDPFANVQAKSLYQTYREWASDNGQYMMSNTKFGREMAKKYTKRKSDGVIVYGGIKLVDIPRQFEHTMNY